MTTTRAGARRAWTCPTGRSSAQTVGRTPSLSVTVEQESSPHAWDADPGVDFWTLTVELRYPARRSAAPPRRVTVAMASLYRVHLAEHFDLFWALDNISMDLGIIASAIVGSKRMAARGIVEGAFLDILIAIDVVVDPFWRGGGLGPSTVLHAADLVRADAVFLEPVALATLIDDQGRCRTSYSRRRPGPTAQAKVEQAWRAAGFRAVRNGVVWAPAEPDRVAAARRTLEAAEDLGGRPQSREWARRRDRRRSTSADRG